MRLPRLYPIVDTEALASRGCTVTDAAKGMIEAGTAILQFRHKHAFSREVFAEAERCSELARQAGVQFVINDRADIALLLGASVHVGMDDLEPAHVRSLIGPGRVIGLSTHNEPQLRASEAEPVDYSALGPIFATASKRNADPVLGVGELQRLRAITTRPLVAIGGVTRENAVDAIGAGADSVAVIGDLLPERCTRASIRRRTEEWLQLLGT